ncbi:MAG: hypothetical protein ACXWYD_19270 [Candidatus Binatia bacterium]
MLENCQFVLPAQGTERRSVIMLCHCQPLSAEAPLAAGYDNATFLAAITCAIAACLCEFLKIEVLNAAGIETLWAMTIAQIFSGQGQMADAAAHGAFALGEQF